MDHQIRDIEELTEEEIQEFLDALPPPAAGLAGVEVNNVPVDSESENCYIAGTCSFSDQVFFDPLDEPAYLGGVEINNVSAETADTYREITVFGLTINDQDDFISVGLVIMLAVLIYVGKSYIDYWFACKLERYREKLQTKE